MPEILVIPRASFRLPEQPAAWPLGDYAVLRQHCWRERAPCETDESWLQLIPYVLLQGEQGQLWCYRRTGGDQRLVERRSCGLGGHVERMDEQADIGAILNNCAWRELEEELVSLDGLNGLDALRPLAWIYEGASAVGRVHLGILFLGQWRGQAPPRIAEGEPMQSLGFFDPAAIVADDAFEHWSRLAADWLGSQRL